MKKEELLNELDEVIGFIETKSPKRLSKEKKNQMVKDTLVNFNEYVSPGWLKYRKSVSTDDAGGAIIEWIDENQYVYGLKGEKFIDCLGGFGIYTCGHRNEEILEVVKAQLEHQALHSQELLDPLRGYLAKAVAEITPGDLKYCFFTNGGAEAVEMALKLARIATGGRWYISTVHAFHGKSMGAVSVGGKSTYRIPYAPMVQQVIHVEYGVAEDIRKAIYNLIEVGEKPAAVILEPIQGEAGVIVPPNGYLKEVRKICDETGVALIFDEIQTGMGRTGTMWRCEAENVTPDIMTFINYKGNSYSVPKEYIGKSVKCVPDDNKLYIYFNTKLIHVYDISNQRINYDKNDYIDALKAITKSSSDDIEEMALKNLEKLARIK